MEQGAVRANRPDGHPDGLFGTMPKFAAFANEADLVVLTSVFK